MSLPRPPKFSIAELETPEQHSPLKPEFLGYTLSSWQRLIDKQGPVLRATIDDKEQVFLCNHETDRRAWKAPDDWLYGSPTSSGDFFLREMGETHITQQDGAAHRRSRKLLLPGFGIGAISRDIEAIGNVIATDLIALRGKPCDFHAELCLIYTRALSRSQVKVDLTSSQLRTLNKFEEWFISGLQLNTEQQLQWHTHPDYMTLKGSAFDLFDGIAKERLTQSQTNADASAPQDTLQILLERETSDAWSPLEAHELRNVIYLLLVAGVGNIANLASCMAWALHKNSPWQAQLSDELADISIEELPGRLKQGLKPFPKLQATIFETERCFLPAPVVPKTTTRDLDVLGYQISAGTQVQQMIGMAHFDEARYPDAQSFKPERWLDGNTVRANAYGGGSHLCLGMGVSRVLLPLTLAALVKDHRLTPEQRSGKPHSLPVRNDIDYSPLATHMDVTLSAS